MWKLIIAVGLYELVVLMVIIYGGPGMAAYRVIEDKSLREHKVNSMVFNVFIWCQWFNLWNSRKIDNSTTFLEGLEPSSLFVGIAVIIGGFQAIIMQTPVGGFFDVKPQSGKEWLVALILGAGTSLVSVLVRKYYKGDEVGGGLFTKWGPPGGVSAAAAGENGAAGSGAGGESETARLVSGASRNG
jgi:P-type Ca2+ transporter type 2C